MKSCPRCHSLLDDGHPFCKKCGYAGHFLKMSDVTKNEFPAHKSTGCYCYMPDATHDPHVGLNKPQDYATILFGIDAIKNNPVLWNVVQLFAQQTAYGAKKYGKTVDPDTLTQKEWIEHLQQELVDSLIYLECMKSKL